MKLSQQMKIACSNFETIEVLNQTLQKRQLSRNVILSSDHENFAVIFDRLDQAVRFAKHYCLKVRRSCVFWTVDSAVKEFMWFFMSWLDLEFLIILSAVQQLSREVVSRLDQYIQRRNWIIMSWSDHERMTLKQRWSTDERDSDVDVLSRLKTSRSWEKDDHFNDVVLLCD